MHNFFTNFLKNIIVFFFDVYDMDYITKAKLEIRNSKTRIYGCYLKITSRENLKFEFKVKSEIFIRIVRHKRHSICNND